MTSESLEQGGVAEEMIGDSEYVRPETAPKDFKPWHKPRKQFVRREQLAAELQRLYETREAPDPLRYLGLPGTDLLDLRYLYEQLCRESGRPLFFIGFNSQARDGTAEHLELGVSLHEIHRLPNVDHQSEVLPDDFRLVGDRQSVAWKRTSEVGPFDVVNIDLCDGIASDPPHRSNSMYRAFDELMRIQSQSLKPWLLLVTTRIGRNSFDPDAQDRIVNLFSRNIHDCDGFSQEWIELRKYDVQSVEVESCGEAVLLDLMTVAIPKWLSALVQAHRPSRVRLMSTLGYQIFPKASVADLISIALLVEPVDTTSTDALSPSPPHREDECHTALAILRQSMDRRNVDSILRQETDLHESLIGETERLLEGARYNVVDYRPWLLLQLTGGGVPSSSGRRD